MKNKYFIGQDYKTNKEKNDILATYDDLQKAKIEFLNNMYDNENTLKNFCSIYKTHIHSYEELLGKDAMFFKELSNVLINKVLGLGEFYNLMVNIETRSTIENAILLLLARYGIIGKTLMEMTSLKWEDIDYEKKRVRIHQSGKAPRYLDVDDRFLGWIDKYKISENYDDVTDFRK